MFTECCLLAWKKYLKVKALPTKMLVPPTFQYYLENAAFLKKSSFFYPAFFQTLKNFNWLYSSWDCVACELIKFNELQVSVNEFYETPLLHPIIYNS